MFNFIINLFKKLFGIKEKQISLRDIKWDEINDPNHIPARQDLPPKSTFFEEDQGLKFDQLTPDELKETKPLTVEEQQLVSQAEAADKFDEDVAKVKDLLDSITHKPEENKQLSLIPETPVPGADISDILFVERILQNLISLRSAGLFGQRPTEDYLKKFYADISHHAKDLDSPQIFKIIEGILPTYTHGYMRVGERQLRHMAAIHLAKIAGNKQVAAYKKRINGLTVSDNAINALEHFTPDEHTQPI